MASHAQQLESFDGASFYDWNIVQSLADPYAAEF
jgi:hypothetical protein